MHHVTFLVLVPAAEEDLFTGETGVDEQHVYAVLQLIPKAVGTATLIQAASGPKPAGNGLIGGPGIGVVLSHGDRQLLEPVIFAHVQGGLGILAELFQAFCVLAAADQNACFLRHKAHVHCAGEKVGAAMGKAAA